MAAIPSAPLLVMAPGHATAAMLETAVVDMREEMMLTMLNTLQAAAATCAGICEGRLRELHGGMLEAIQEEERKRSLAGSEAFLGDGPLPVINAPFAFDRSQPPRGSAEVKGTVRSVTAPAAVFAMDADSSDSDVESHDDVMELGGGGQAPPSPTAQFATFAPALPSEPPSVEKHGHSRGGEGGAKKASITSVGRSAMGVGSGLARSALGGLGQSKRAATALKQSATGLARDSMIKVTGSSGSSASPGFNADSFEYRPPQVSPSRAPPHGRQSFEDDFEVLDVAGDASAVLDDDAPQPRMTVRLISSEGMARDLITQTADVPEEPPEDYNEEASQPSAASTRVGAGADSGAKAGIPSRAPRRPLPAAFVSGAASAGGSKSRPRSGGSAGKMPERL